jgi:hypothetical protein
MISAVLWINTGSGRSDYGSGTFARGGRVEYATGDVPD